VLIETIIFYAFCAMFVGSALMVVSSRNTVHAALFLVLTFFSATALWLFLEAEFLALVLILVYVGAVMTLFLFVVMMLNLDIAPKKEGFVKFLPFGLAIVTLIVAAMVYVIGPHHFGLTHMPAPKPEAANYSNIKELGAVLYTHYVYPFELAAVLLLIAIIAAISLSLRKPRGKTQDIKQQLQVDPKERIRIVK